MKLLLSWRFSAASLSSLALVCPGCSLTLVSFPSFSLFPIPVDRVSPNRCLKAFQLPLSLSSLALVRPGCSLTLVSFPSFSLFPIPVDSVRPNRCLKARHAADSFEPAEWSERLPSRRSGWLGAAVAGSIPAFSTFFSLLFLFFQRQHSSSARLSDSKGMLGVKDTVLRRGLASIALATRKTENFFRGMLSAFRAGECHRWFSQTLLPGHMLSPVSVAWSDILSSICRSH